MDAEIYQKMKLLEKENQTLRNELATLRDKNTQLQFEKLRLDVILKHVPIILWSADIDGIFTSSEGLGLGMLGLKQGQVVGLSLFEIYKDFPEIVMAHNKTFEGIPTNFKFQIEGIQHIDKGIPLEKTIFDAATIPIINDQGYVDGIIGVAYEIDKELIQLIESANAPIIGIDVDGNVNEWNKSATSITGFLKEEVMGQNLVESRIPDEYKVHVKQILDNALRGTETSNYIFSLLSKNESRVILLFNAAPRVDKYGNITGVIGIGQDITELDNSRIEMENIVKKRTSELEKSLFETQNAKNELDLILNSIQSGVIVTSKEFKVILINPKGQDILNEDTNQQFWYQIKKLTKSEDFKDNIDVHKFDFKLKLIGKELKVIRTFTSMIRDKNNQNVGYVSILNDVTFETKVDQMKTDFISTAAHELRTPLTTIQGYSEILLTRKEISEHEKEKFLGYINSKSVSLAKIINDLLDVSRIESGLGMILDKVECNLGDGVNEVVESFIEKYQDFDFELHLLEGTITAFVDKAKFAQVLENLLSNAIKYCSNNKKIVITCEIENNFYSVKVRDCGIGLRKEELDNLFTKFYRVDTTNSAIEGTGLGLVIVKAIVELHGGQVIIKSVYGEGSTFGFTIPLN